MARANNGGWDFVKVGETYQYKEEASPMTSFIAMVKILENNSTEDEYRFKLQVEESNMQPPTDDGTFEISNTKTESGYYSGMPQFYKIPEYICHYTWIRGGGKSVYSPNRDTKVTGVRLTKLKEAENPASPNNIQEGFVIEGNFIGEPKVDDAFCVGGALTTSRVVEILSPNTFKTKNSIYQWEKIEAEN